ncbi:hypothetical protein LJC32_01385 [Oscillospiraceae bacterium OttesenSCG-928-F05]|nr:hypothetical protein [Oscillospiraceae bacterium OttesenSCG-928-F05]
MRISEMKKNNDADKTYAIIPELQALLDDPSMELDTRIPEEKREHRRKVMAIVDTTRQMLG